MTSLQHDPVHQKKCLKNRKALNPAFKGCDKNHHFSKKCMCVANYDSSLRLAVSEEEKEAMHQLRLLQKEIYEAEEKEWKEKIAALREYDATERKKLAKAKRELEKVQLKLEKAEARKRQRQEEGILSKKELKEMKAFYTERRLAQLEEFADQGMRLTDFDYEDGDELLIQKIPYFRNSVGYRSYMRDIGK